jgi:hypothetical protein
MGMRQIGREGAAGLLDKVFGLTKEIFGEIFGSAHLIDTGVSQQRRGSIALQASRDGRVAEPGREQKTRAQPYAT